MIKDFNDMSNSSKVLGFNEARKELKSNNIDKFALVVQRPVNLSKQFTENPILIEGTPDEIIDYVYQRTTYMGIDFYNQNYIKKHRMGEGHVDWLLDRIPSFKGTFNDIYIITAHRDMAIIPIINLKEFNYGSTNIL